MKRAPTVRPARNRPTNHAPAPAAQRGAAAEVPAPQKKIATPFLGHPWGSGWTVEETGLLRDSIAKGRSPKKAQSDLQGRGFFRTVKAVKEMAARLGLVFAARDGRGLDGAEDVVFLAKHVALGLSLDELVQAFAERGVKIGRSLIAERIHALGLTRPAKPEKPKRPLKTTAEWLAEEEDEDLRLAAAKAACAAHLEDLKREHGAPPPDVRVRRSEAPRATIAPLSHSPEGSPAAYCVEMAGR